MSASFSNTVSAPSPDWDPVAGYERFRRIYMGCDHAK